MSEQEFKALYIVTFMATYTATNNDRLCAEGKHEQLENHRIVEDAVFLANHAWKAYQVNKQ